MSIVEPQFCRNEPFERFAFRVNEEGIPEVCDMPQPTSNRNDLVALLEDCYGGAIERITLVHKLEAVKGISDKAAQMQIKRAIDSGLLQTDGDLVRVRG